MLEILCIILSGFVGLAFWFHFVNLKHPLYPSLPRVSFPILGHVPYILMRKKQAMHRLLQEWAEKSNSGIIGVDIGSYRCVIISNHKILKEAFSHPHLNGRPNSEGIRIRGMEDGVYRGLANSSGIRYDQQRKFVLKHLKTLGFGKTAMEVPIQAQASELVRKFEENVGIPISTEKRFLAASINTIWEMCTTDRVSQDDLKQELVDAIKANTQNADIYGAILFFPWLCKLAPKITGYHEYVEGYALIFKYMEKLIEDRYIKFRSEEYERNDLIDAYFREMERCTDTTIGFTGEDGKKNLTCTLADLFLAGSDTTGTTMSWLCLYMALNPEIQKNMQEEIDMFVGQNRTPSIDDKSSMPYTEACIMETLRKSSILHLGIAHRAEKDTNLIGTFIPKDTILMSNIFAMHHDKNVWGDDVDTFRPERFLSSDKSRIVNSEYLIAFSSGKRLCPGDSVAKIQLFLFTTYIFQRFNVILDPNSPNPSIEHNIVGVICSPPPHKLVFAERDNI